VRGVVRLADGQQRVVSSDLPNYSAKVGQVTVQHGERSFAIQSTQPTLSTEGKVTGSAFKPNAPEGAHWQLIKLNGQKVDSTNRKRDYMNAMMQSPTKNDALKKLLKKALTTKINDREMFMKGIDYSYYYEEND